MAWGDRVNGSSPAPSETTSEGWGSRLSQTPGKTSGGGVVSAVEHLPTNFLKDVGQAALGIPAGIVHLADLEVAAAKKSQGNPSRFLVEFLKPVAKETVSGYASYYSNPRNLYEHPLQPVLDALTLASLGGAAGVRAGLLSGERGAIVTRSPRAIATGKGPTNVELTGAAPIVKGRMLGVEKARAAVAGPEGITRLGLGGEVKRFGTQIQKQASQNVIARLPAYVPYAKATRKLSPDEWAALHIRATNVHPDDLATLWKGTPNEAAVTDPKIRALVLAPSSRMLRAEPEARALSVAGQQLFERAGQLDPAFSAARPDLIRRQASDLLGREAAPIPGVESAYYFPHTLEPVAVKSPLRTAGGGKAPPRRLGTTKQNLGVLSLAGKIHLRGDVLGPEFLRRVKFVKYQEIHNALVRGAIRVTRADLEQTYGSRLPQGYEYVRRSSGQRIPPSMRGESEISRPLENLIPNPTDLRESPLASEGFTTTKIEEAHQSGGRYYIVPKVTAKAATGEFTRSGAFLYWLNRYPLAAWRAIVLGLRVGFLTNNLLGNSLMYAVRTGGQGALRDLFAAFLEMHGRQTGLRILRSSATPPEMRAALLREFFPEQFAGTFGRTQSPSTAIAGPVGRVGETTRTVTGALPRLTSKVAEEVPRAALLRNFIRNSPEFKRVYRALPKQTRSFEQAARQLLEGKGGKAYQARISKEVNQALGDYLHLNSFERNFMRNLLPFYSWYRAIVTATFHLAVDTPLRANILGQIGQIGYQQNQQQLGDVPSFLRGAIPIGQGPEGTKRVISTQAANPYATIEQIRRGAASDIGDLGLNPFLYAAIQAAQNAPEGKISPTRLAYQSLFAIGRGLPPSRLVAPFPPSRLYPTRSRKSEVLSYLGVPVKEYNPGEAARQKGIGR